MYISRVGCILSRHLRFQSQEWATHHVISRCLGSHSDGFLKPTRDVVAICAGVLGRTLSVYNQRVELHHYAFLSNHFHLLITSQDTTSLAAFMQHLKGNLARQLNRLYGRSGPLWHSRYTNIELLDEEALTEAFRYITENSVKEGLVAHPSEWSGLHGSHQLLDETHRVGQWISRSDVCVNKHPSVIDYPIILTKPQVWSLMRDDVYKDHCKKLTDLALESAYAKRRNQIVGSSITPLSVENSCKVDSKPKANIPPVMGMEAVLAESIYKARKKIWGRRPLCRARSCELEREYHTAYKAFEYAYRTATHLLREVLLGRSDWRRDITFPYGGVLPSSLASLVYPIAT